jgi:hypothetical protein
MEPLIEDRAIHPQLRSVLAGLLLAALQQYSVVLALLSFPEKCSISWKTCQLPYNENGKSNRKIFGAFTISFNFHKPPF